MKYQLELRHIRYFLAVAEELHFRKAAEKLFIAQPGLSRQIKELESSLGITLFERHNRKVSLTPAGTYLQTALATSLKDIDRSIQHAAHLHNGLKGDLRVGYVGSAMENVIPKLMIQFRKIYPSILFSLREMDNQKQIDQLTTNELDIGFTRLEDVPTDISIHQILEESFCLIVPKGHAINHRNFKGLEQFSKESFILFESSYSPSYYQKVMQLFRESGFTPKVAHNTIHASSIYRLVENGFGVSIVPESLRLAHFKGVQYISLDQYSARTSLSAIWYKENRNPILGHFLEVVGIHK